MSQFDAAQAREWFEILYGDTPGYVNICATGAWVGRNFESGDIDGILDYIAALDAQGREGIYARVTTLRELPPEHSRGPVELSFYLPGLWADIDLAGPGHKGTMGLPESIDDAMRIVEASGLPEPSHWVHSGGGLYPWWLLREPVEIDDREFYANLASGWVHILADAAEKLGFKIDKGVGDLARVLRVPGTVNRKEGLARGCGALEGHSWSGRLYTVDELTEAMVANIPLPPEPPPIVKRMTTVDGLRPGDDFNQKVSWQQLLIPLGWQWLHPMTDGWALRRPGKTEGALSATLKDSTDRIFIFSDQAHPFESWRPYDKFGVYALIEHGGHFGEAAKALRKDGYGERREAVYETGTLAVGSPPDATGQQLVSVQMSQSSSQVASSFDAKALKPVVNERLFSTFRWDELGAADMWVNTFGSHITYVHSTKSWIFFDGKRWAQANMKIAEYAARQLVEGMNIYASEVADEELAKNLRKSAKALSSNSKIKGIVEQASNDPRANSYIDSFDKDPNLLCLDNGVLNLTTMQLGGHDPKLMQRGKLNASFDPDTGTGRWEQFITQLFPDPQVRDYVQRAFGYMLLGVPDERVMFMLFGPSGTGKTQLLEAIRVVMGDFAGVAPASAFEPRQRGYKGPSEDLHKLMGTRFVIQSELDASAALNEPLIKSIVGADTQTTRPLYGQPVDWTPQYVVFLATNFLPSLSSSDDAIWNRIKAIKMDNVFVDERGRPTDPAFKNIGRKLADECAPEILNWLLTGLSAYRERGLTEPEQVSSWVDQYRDEVDTTRQFIKEAAEDGRIVVAPAEQSVSRELHKAYLEWAADNSIKPLGLRKFNERLESSGWVKERRDKGACWQGIGVIGRFTSTIYPPGHWPRQ